MSVSIAGLPPNVPVVNAAQLLIGSVKSVVAITLHGWLRGFLHGDEVPPTRF
jgi:hypothetical protein